MSTHVDLLNGLQALDKRLSYPGDHAAGALSHAMRSAGFNRIERPSVMVEFFSTFGATASFDGDYGTAQRRTVSSPALGMDNRRLFPVLPFESVEFSTNVRRELQTAVAHAAAALDDDPRHRRDERARSRSSVPKQS